MELVPDRWALFSTVYLGLYGHFNAQSSQMSERIKASLDHMTNCECHTSCTSSELSEGHLYGNIAVQNWNKFNPNPLVPEDIITANPLVVLQSLQIGALSRGREEDREEDSYSLTGTSLLEACSYP